MRITESAEEFSARLKELDVLACPTPEDIPYFNEQIVVGGLQGMNPSGITRRCALTAGKRTCGDAFVRHCFPLVPVSFSRGGRRARGRPE
jgi:hypothetical protein